MSSLAISVFFVNINLSSSQITNSATIPAVDVSKTYIQPSAVMPSPRLTGGSAVNEGDGEFAACFVKLTNATTVTVTRNAVPGSAFVFLRFKGYVVEFLQPDAPTSINVDYFQLSLRINVGLTSASVTIPAVVVANTYIQLQQSQPSKINSTTNPDVQDGQIVSTFVKLTNSTTVTHARDPAGPGGPSIDGKFMICEFT